MTTLDWDIVTSYTDSVSTTLKTVTFPKVQESVYLRNQGNADFNYTIGSQSGVLSPSQSVTVKEDVSSFTLQAVSGIHTFELRAKEKGTEQTDAGTDVMSLLAEITSITARSIADFPKIIPESDDTARIQRLIDAVASAGGGFAALKLGTYTASNIELKSNVILCGQGNGTVIQNNGQANPMIFAGSLTKDCSYAGIENLKIDGLNTATHGLKLIYFVNRSYVRNVTIENSKKNVFIQKSWYANFLNVRSIKGDIGFEIYGSSTGEQVNGLIFDACYSSTHTQNAVYLYGSGKANSFNGCTFEATDQEGFKIAGTQSGISLSGCYFENNGKLMATPTDIYVNVDSVVEGGLTVTGGVISKGSIGGISIDYVQGASLVVSGVHFGWNGQGVRPDYHVRSTAVNTTILPSTVNGYANVKDFEVTGSSNYSLFGKTSSSMNITSSNTMTINKSFNVNTIKVTADYDMRVSDIVPVILCDATGGTINVMNPQANLCKGTRFIVKKIDSTTSSVVVKEPVNANKIDGIQYYYLKNQYDYVEYVSDGTQFLRVACSVAERTTAFNGDGVMTSKTLPHGLTVTPSKFYVYPNSADAGNAGIKYVTADATNITVFFNTPPVSGTNNISLRWKAEQ